MKNNYISFYVILAVEKANEAESFAKVGKNTVQRKNWIATFMGARFDKRDLQVFTPPTLFRESNREPRDAQSLASGGEKLCEERYGKRQASRVE